jgi:hypothetical protein
MRTKEKVLGFSFRNSNRSLSHKSEGADPCQRLFLIFKKVRGDLPSDLIKEIVFYFSDCGLLHAEHQAFTGFSSFPSLSYGQKATSKFKEGNELHLFLDKTRLFKGKDIINGIHDIILLYLRAKKENIAGAWLLPATESLEYIIALKEFTLDTRSEFYDLLDLLKDHDVFAAIKVRFHLIPASEITNINTEKVEALPIAA